MMYIQSTLGYTIRLRFQSWVSLLYDYDMINRFGRCVGIDSTSTYIIGFI
jgi:hypothetical protein